MEMRSALRKLLVLMALSYTMLGASAVFAAITCTPSPQTVSLKPGSNQQISYSCSLNGHVIPESFSLQLQSSAPVNVQPGGYGNPYRMTVSIPGGAAPGTYFVSVSAISINRQAYHPASGGLEVIVQAPQPTAPEISWPSSAADVSAVPDYTNHVVKVSWNANATVIPNQPIQYSVSLNGSDITSADCDVAQSNCRIPASALTSGTQYTVMVTASVTGAKSASNSTQFLWSPPVVLQSISVDPLTASIEVGKTQQFTQSCAFSDQKPHPCPATLTWASSNSSLATVNSNGLATGVTAGIVNITVSDSATGLSSAPAELNVTPLPQTAAPTFSPVAGTYTSAQSVTLSDATAGAKIYYTTNGDQPTTDSTLYSTAISVGSSQTIKAIAVANGYTQSAMGSAAYTINIPQPAATPTFSPAAGTYTSAQSVTLSDATAGAKIYYTTNGDQPTTDSTLYSTGISVGASQTIKAIAVANGYTQSAVGSATYTINIPQPAATPTFSPAAGTYTSAQSVTLSDATAGAKIYYTTNGDQPTTDSTLYSTAISVGASQTIKAIAVANGYTQSTMGSATYTINIPVPPSYVGTLSCDSSVMVGQFYHCKASFQVKGSGGKIPAGTIAFKDTLDLTGSTAACELINDGAECTRNVSVGTAPAGHQSDSITATYTNPEGATAATDPAVIEITPIPQTPAPQFSLPEGTYPSAQSVTLSDGVTGAAIYYTIDNTQPTINSTRYTTPISVASSQTINAIAVASGYSPSTVASAVYVIATSQQPNVVVQGTPFCTPSPLYTGGTATCQVALENTGGADATGLSYSAVYVTGVSVGNVTGCDATIPAGKGCTASFTVTAPAQPNPGFGAIFYINDLRKSSIVVPVIAGSGNVYVYGNGISCVSPSVSVGSADTCSAQFVNYGSDAVTPSIQPTVNGVAISGGTATCSQSTQNGTPCTVTFQYRPTVVPSPSLATISYTYAPIIAPPSTTVTVYNPTGTLISLSKFTCTPTSVNVNGNLQCTAKVKNITDNDLSNLLYYSVLSAEGPAQVPGCSSIASKKSCELSFTVNAPSSPTSNLMLTLKGGHNEWNPDATSNFGLPFYNISAGLLSCYPWTLTPDKNTAQCNVVLTDNGQATSGLNATVVASKVNKTTISNSGGCGGGIPQASCNYQFSVTASGASPKAQVQAKAQDGSVLLAQQASFDYYASNLVPTIFQCKNAVLQANEKTSCSVVFINQGSQPIIPNVKITLSEADGNITNQTGCNSAIASGGSCQTSFDFTAGSPITAVTPLTISVASNGSTKNKIVMLVPTEGGGIVGSVTGADSYTQPQTPITIPFYFATQQGNQNKYYYTLHNLVVANGNVLTASLNYHGSCITAGDHYLSGVAGCNDRLENFTATNYALHPGDQVTFYAWMTYGSSTSVQPNSSNLVSWTVVLGDPPIFSQVLSNQLSIVGGNTFAGAFMFDNNSGAVITGLQPVVQNLPAGFQADPSCTYQTSLVNQQCGSNLTTLQPGQACYACFTSVNPATKGVSKYTLTGVLQYAQSTAVNSKDFPVILYHRKFTINNNCGGSVWPAFVRGAAYYFCNHNNDCPSGTVCYKEAHQCQVVPTEGYSSNGGCGADTSPSPAAFIAQLGTSEQCSKGCNAYPNACPKGSSCEASTGLCYWDLPKMTSNTSAAPTDPLNTFRIQSGKTAVFEFPNVPRTQAAGWSTVTSGAMYARTGCTVKDNQLTCQAADCTTASDGSCTTGPLAPSTKMEYTLLFENQDYYDVGVINGFNIPISMSPDNATPSDTDPYVCRPAGAPINTTITVNGQSSNTSNNCTWVYNMINPTQDNPSQQHSALYIAQHTYVTKGTTTCNTSPYTCSNGEVCGISQENVGNGTLTCGTVIGFWTTNQLCSEPKANAVNPTIYKNICTPWGAQPKSAWLGCSGTDGSQNSCYQPGNPSGQCCGCPFWSGVYKPNKTEGPLPSALQYLTQLFQTNNVVTLSPNGQNLYCTNYNNDWINNILLPDLVWMKQGCTSTYTFAFDDPTSTFTCNSATGGSDTINKQNYTITLCPSPGTINGKQVSVPD